MLTRWLASHQAVGRTALLNFLSSNPDVLDVCIDQCYSLDAALARAYFQVGKVLTLLIELKRASLQAQ